MAKERYTLNGRPSTKHEFNAISQHTLSHLNSDIGVSGVNISLVEKRRSVFKSGLIVGGQVLRLFVPLFAVILLFRFIYQGQNAQISFALVWEQLGSFDVGYTILLRCMESISGLNIDFSSLPSVDSVSDFFDYIGALGGLIGDFFKGIFAVLALPIGLIASAFEVISFAFNVLFAV